MHIVISYYVRDTYTIPDEKWQEAMALYRNDEDDAVDFLIEEGELDDHAMSSDIIDCYVEVGE
jgi:hypothetical protein